MPLIFGNSRVGVDEQLMSHQLLAPGSVTGGPSGFRLQGLGVFAQEGRV